MAVFDFAACLGGRSALALDPLLRAAALAVVMQRSQTEFGMMARITNPRAVRLRSNIRIGHAVREADGTIIPPGCAFEAEEGPVLTSLRVTLPEDVRDDVFESMRALSATFDGIHEEGWAVEVRGGGSCGIHDRPPLTLETGPVERRDASAPPAVADGAGVLVGAVDFGCAFAHPAFRIGDDGMSGTRLRVLWDQNAPAQPGQNLPGRFFGPAQIDAALATPDPYATLDYRPWDNGYAPTDAVQTPLTEMQRQKQVHGTHVLSVAAGRRPARGIWAAPTPAGVAPGAALGFVHLRPRALISEGDAVDVFDGVAALFALADQEGMPAVVNLSIGANTGAHDGQGLMDRAFDAMLRAPGRAITVAAGNMRRAAQHWKAKVTADAPVILGWRFAGGDRTPNMLRVYAPMPSGRSSLSMAIARPGGEPGSALASGALQAMEVDRLLDAAGKQIIGTAVATTHPFSTEETLQHFEVRLRPSGAEEIWQVTLSLDAENAPAEVAFDAWIERDDLRREDSSRFDPLGGPGDDAGCSLGSLACSAASICVGAHELPGGAAAGFSSLGPTRSGEEKPDVAAPGRGIRGAAGRGGLLDASGVAFDASFRMDGTSAAAPHVAGIVALMLQARPRLGAAAIRRILRETTHERQSAAGLPWAHDLGCGRVDGNAALARALEEMP
jgi:subtilisin family serine protease